MPCVCSSRFPVYVLSLDKQISDLYRDTNIHQWSNLSTKMDHELFKLIKSDTHAVSWLCWKSTFLECILKFTCCWADSGDNLYPGGTREEQKSLSASQCIIYSGILTKLTSYDTHTISYHVHCPQWALLWACNTVVYNLISSIEYIKWVYVTWRWCLVITLCNVVQMGISWF